MKHILKEVNNYLPFNYDVFFVGLYGSQNYGTNTPNSDFDTKCIVIPSRIDIMLGRPMISTEIKIPGYGICAIKDIRLFIKELIKGNINFLEVLFTESVWVNPAYAADFYQLRKWRDKIAEAYKFSFLNCAFGMVNTIYKKSAHTGKHQGNLERLNYFMNHFNATNNFAESIKPRADVRERILNLKLLVDKADEENFNLQYAEAENNAKYFVPKNEALANEMTHILEDFVCTLLLAHQFI